MLYISHSEEETKEIGKRIAATLRGGEVVALEGDLGAGKTILTKGVAEGLGYKKMVNSPTFMLMKIYSIERRTSEEKQIKFICHIDAYRISSAEEIEAIGVLEYFGRKDTVSIVEWPERIKNIIPRKAIWIKLNYAADQTLRKIKTNK